MVSETPIEQAPAAAEPLKQGDAAAEAEPEVVAPAENGGPAEENGQENGDHGQKPAGAAAAEANGEPAEEELWRRRLWFVRVPRPPEVVAVKGLELELETYRAQHKLLTESFTVKRVERDAARENTRAARDAFKVCKEAYEAKRAIVQPMRDAAQNTSGEAKKLRETFSELDVRTEAELDERLQQMHYRIEHESIPLNEEKRLLQLIKKLESQRPKVREYESLVGTLAESRSEVKRLEGELAEHKAELAALQGEKNTQWTILEKFREQEQALDKEVEDILTERKRIKDILDEAYSRVAELKSTQKAKNDEFFANRRFSRTIRELLTAGKLEEARELCSQQMEEAHAKLSSDADYRAEYFALWEQQRKTPVSMAALEEVEERPAVAAGKGRKERRQEQQPPAIEPAKKAEQVIAAVLEEARGEIMRIKAASASAAAAAAPAPAVAEPLEATPEVEPEPAPKPAAKPPKPKPVARHLVEVPVIPEDNFELPEVIKTAKKAPSTEELKALEREHQRQVQLDAERRKQRKQQEKEKKRQRALQEQAAKARQAASSAPATPLDSDVPPEQSGDESGVEAAPSLAAAAEQAPAASAAPAVQPTAAGKAAAVKPSKVAALVGKPKSTARRPANTKKPLAKQLRSWWKEYQLLVAAGALVFLFLLLFIGYITVPSREAAAQTAAA